MCLKGVKRFKRGLKRLSGFIGVLKGFNGFKGV